MFRATRASTLAEDYGGFVFIIRSFYRGPADPRSPKKRQTVCKPGSVPAREGDRRPFIWDARCRTPRATYPDGERGNTPAMANHDAPSLFGLAPGGVYLAADVAAGAVRSYRTLSPLPAYPGCPGRRGGRFAFCGTDPWGRPRRALPGTVFPWSPDFPPPDGSGGGRPTV